MNQLGLRTDYVGQVPEDEYTKARREVDQHRKGHTSGSPKQDPLKKFLENDRKVLRFFCVWDDRASPFGDLRRFVSWKLSSLTTLRSYTTSWLMTQWKLWNNLNKIVVAIPSQHLSRDRNPHRSLVQWQI